MKQVSVVFKYGCGPCFWNCQTVNRGLGFFVHAVCISEVLEYLLARKTDIRCNLVEIASNSSHRDAVLDTGAHFHGEGPTDIAQQSRTTLVVSVLGIASFAIVCGAWKDSSSFKARPRCFHADGGIQRCVGIDAFENISNALVVVAIGELHRSVFFAPFASRKK